MLKQLHVVSCSVHEARYALSLDNLLRINWFHENRGVLLRAFESELRRGSPI